MAQGAGLKNLKKASKSAGSQRRKAQVKKASTKGRMQKKARRTHAVASAKPQTEISKSISRKNESLVAAKAIANGMHFSLKDLTTNGTKEHKAQLKARDKKQDSSTKLTGRLKDQIQKLKEGSNKR